MSIENINFFKETKSSTHKVLHKKTRKIHFIKLLQYISEKGQYIYNKLLDIDMD